MTSHLTLLICYQQFEVIIKTYLTNVKFTESTKHSSTFKVSEPSFWKLYNWVKSEGYNPFALMTW